MDIASLNEIMVTVGSGFGLWILKRIAGSMKALVEELSSLRELPDKLEETTKRIEDKYDKRFLESEKRQDILQQQMQVTIDKLLELGSRP